MSLFVSSFPYHRKVSVAGPLVSSSLLYTHSAKIELPAQIDQLLERFLLSPCKSLKAKLQTMTSGGGLEPANFRLSKNTALLTYTGKWISVPSLVIEYYKITCVRARTAKDFIWFASRILSYTLQDIRDIHMYNYYIRYSWLPLVTGNQKIKDISFSLKFKTLSFVTNIKLRH